MPLESSNLHFYGFIRHFCAPSTSAWRIQAQQRQLVSQISSILLQRHNWLSLLTNLNLSSKLTPPIFLQILDKIQSNPQISLNFFNWAKSNLGLQPGLKAHCKIIRTLTGSGNTRPIKPILDSIIGVDPPGDVVCSMIQACKGTDLHPLAFSSIIECYAQKGFYFQGLEVYKEIVPYGYLPKISCFNTVLDVLERVGEFRLASCFYGSMIRNGVLSDMNTWSIIARILCKNGKFERVVRLLDFGVCNSAMFDLVIDCYSRIGDFGAAMDQLNEMCRRNLEPGFSTYGSILDGACKFGNANVIDTILCKMKEKKLLPQNLSSGFDVVIRKFCDLGKTYAAELLFKRARDERIGLKDETFGYMLRAFCKGGRINEAIGLYEMMISNEKIVVNKCSYQELADSLCKENPSENTNQMLIDLVKRGFSPSLPEISRFMMQLGRKAMWQEAEDLLNVMLQAGLLPDSCCCRLLVKHYCSMGQIDYVLLLHDKSEKLEMVWDVTTYNMLLRALFMAERVDKAVNIFCRMRRKNLVNRASFIVMISGLSQKKEMRKAMEVHDEMLKMGLKPSSKTYKSLISVFR